MGASLTNTVIVTLLLVINALWKHGASNVTAMFYRLLWESVISVVAKTQCFDP